MRRSKLLIYTGMPIFGFSTAYLSSIGLGPLYYIDVVPILAIFYIHDVLIFRLDKDIHNVLEISSLIGCHIAFWLPIAYVINRLYERRQGSRDAPPCGSGPRA